MQICMDLGDRQNFADSNPNEDAELLQELLRSLIRQNIVFLKYHTAPPLYQSGVVYQRTKNWDRIPKVVQKGYGDCKSLSAWLIAEYHLQGVEARPEFRWVPRPDGGKDFHILVLSEHGAEDPSKALGMNAQNSKYFPPWER